VRIWQIDLGQERAGAALLRIGDPGDRADEFAVGKLRYAHDGIDAWRHAEGGVLRHVDPDADHVDLHDLEHEGAAGGVALHQTANVDVALSDDPVERRDHGGIVPVLTELLDELLLSQDVMLRDGNCGLPRLEGLEVDVALLWGNPALLDQRFVPAPGHLCEFSAGLRLLPRRLELIDRRLVLRDLVVELGYRELRQQISRLDAIPDLNIALVDIAGRAGKDVRRGECGRRARQGD